MNKGSVQYRGTIPVYVEPKKSATKTAVRVADKRTPKKEKPC